MLARMQCICSNHSRITRVVFKDTDPPPPDTEKLSSLEEMAQLPWLVADESYNGIPKRQDLLNNSQNGVLCSLRRTSLCMRTA